MSARALPPLTADMPPIVTTGRPRTDASRSICEVGQARPSAIAGPAPPREGDSRWHPRPPARTAPARAPAQPAGSRALLLAVGYGIAWDSCLDSQALAASSSVWSRSVQVLTGSQGYLEDRRAGHERGGRPQVITILSHCSMSPGRSSTGVFQARAHRTPEPSAFLEE